MGRYTWDHRNRLTKVEIFSETTGAAVRTVTHTYDVDNRRISRFVDEGSDFSAFGGPIDNRDYFYKRRFEVSRPRWPNGDNVVLTLAQNMAVEHRYRDRPVNHTPAVRSRHVELNGWGSGVLLAGQRSGRSSSRSLAGWTLTAAPGRALTGGLGLMAGGNVGLEVGGLWVDGPNR
ncbi:hypothetical protein K2X85_14405 [bacterium]|nr:hypothetical protein [bacterium]